jgi:heptose I phosphotransferase
MDGLCAFLKIETRVKWGQRWKAWRDGLGFVSLSQREARLLNSLEREQLPGPGWIAFGRDSRGRHFLLVAEKQATADLGMFLSEEMNPWRRRRAAIKLGRSMARLHAAGFCHQDLYAKHILVDVDTGEPTLLDWQRSRRVVELSRDGRLADLAALHATVDEALASSRERQLLLRAYLREARRRAGCLWGGFAMRRGESYDPGEFTREERKWLLRADLESNAADLVFAKANRLLKRRHVREKRLGSGRADGLNWIPLAGEEMMVTSSWPPEHSTAGKPQRDRLEAAIRDAFDAAEGSGEFAGTVRLDEDREAFIRGRMERAAGADAPLWHSEECREAGLYHQLEKHAVPGPRVLAVGRSNVGSGRSATFVMVEPAAHSVPLLRWLQSHSAAKSSLTVIMADIGRVLARVHGARCLLTDGANSFAALEVGYTDPETSPPSGRGGVVLAPGGASRSAWSWLGRGRDLNRLCRELATVGVRTEHLAALRRAHALELAETRRAGENGSVIDPSGGGLMENEDTAGTTARFRSLPRPRQGWWKAWTQGTLRGVERADWPRLAGTDWAATIMDANLTDRFHTKQGRSIARWTLADPRDQRDLVVFVKRHHKLPWLHGLFAWLAPGGKWSPALQEWQHLEWAQRQGVPVPEVVAAAEYLGPGTRLSSVLVTEELTGMLPLHEAIPQAARDLPADVFRTLKKGLAWEMARLSRLLHDRRCFHKDLYLCHFYVRETDLRNPPADWRGRVVMIDLHRLARHRFTYWIWQVKDLAQLLYSSEVEGVTARDRLEFWRAYRSLGENAKSLRLIGALVRAKYRRYAEHNRKLKLKKGQTAHPAPRREALDKAA